MNITLGDDHPIYLMVYEIATMTVQSFTKTETNGNTIDNSEDIHGPNGPLFGRVQCGSKAPIVQYMSENQITDPNDYLSQFE